MRRYHAGKSALLSEVPGPGPPSKFASDRNPVTAFLREAGLIQYARVRSEYEL